MFETPYLLAGLVFGSVGLGYFIYGKKQKHKVAFYSGIGLMVYPIVVTDLRLMIAVGIGLMLLPRFVRLQ